MAIVRIRLVSSPHKAFNDKLPRVKQPASRAECSCEESRGILSFQEATITVHRSRVGEFSRPCTRQRNGGQEMLRTVSPAYSHLHGRQPAGYGKCMFR
jgi:hypothetical protein